MIKDTFVSNQKPTWYWNERHNFRSFCWISLQFMRSRWPVNDPNLIIRILMYIHFTFLKYFLRSFRNLKWFSPFSLQGDSPFGKTEAYIKLEQLGEGSYATVFKGYSKWVDTYFIHASFENETLSSFASSITAAKPFSAVIFMFVW